MKIVKRIIGICFVIALLAAISVFTISSSATSDDPADNYKVQVAPYEDSSLKLWFDYSFRKTFTSDTTPTGMNTFSIYMAKNEIEDAQFVLYSDTTMSSMSATLSPFTDSNGNTVEAEIYYEMYVTTENLNSLTVLGSTSETTFIREGETPDPIVPLNKVKTFQLNGGKSQAFLIRAKTAEDSISGWYSAQLDIKNADGNIVKTATVYLYVWNFALSEETAMETSFYISPDTSFGGDYQTFYDYLLENRICGMDVPTGLISDSYDYMMKDRVVSVRLSDAKEHNAYMSRGTGATSTFKSIYNTIVEWPEWEQIKGKIYAYPADEPLPYEVVGSNRDTVDTVAYYSAVTEAGWGEDIRTVITTCENHAYPYNTHTNPISTYAQADLQDSIQAMIDQGYVTLWCPRIYEFTPYSYIQNMGTRKWENYDPIRNSSIYPYAGVYGKLGAAGVGYMDWEGFYGAETPDRMLSTVTYRNQINYDGTEHELWTYGAGYNKSYTYCNHMIENTGLQTKMLFWQCFQEDITGYLNYSTNGWKEYVNYHGANTSTPYPGGNGYDITVTGAKKTCMWYTNRYNIGSGHYVFGNGVLFYGRIMAKVSVPVVGSLRVELLRDGIEEYQMMYQLEQLKGETVAKSYVNSVCNNVVDYLSMPNYNRSAWDSSMDDYDVMEYARRSLGNALEAASVEECEHNWSKPVVSTAATCTKTGRTVSTCTKCGADKFEVIPSIHTQDYTFEVIGGVDRTCTTDGSRVYKCKLCGFEKTVKLIAYHNDNSALIPEQKSSTAHKLICPNCDKVANDAVGHSMFNKVVQPTCQADGYKASECKICGYKENEVVLEKVDHNFVDGYCTMCGLSDGTNVPEEPEEPEVMYGDTNGDGKINALDANYLAQIIVGNAASVEAADISKDGKVNATDSNLLKQIIAGTYTISQ